MEPSKRRGRPGDPEPEPTEPPAEPTPARPEEPAPRRKGDRKAGRPELRKVKRTYSLYEDLASKLSVTAAMLGVDECELLDAIVRPALKGYSAPTIPDGLKGMFGRGGAPAN